jgi:hypothetical protein
LLYRRRGKRKKENGFACFFLLFFPCRAREEKRCVHSFLSLSLHLPPSVSLFFLSLSLFICRAIQRRARKCNVVLSLQARLGKDSMLIVYSSNGSRTTKRTRRNGKNERCSEGRLSYKKVHSIVGMSYVVRSFSHSLLYLTTPRRSSLFLFVLSVSSTESRYSTQCLDNNLMFLCVCVCVVCVCVFRFLETSTLFVLR